MTKKAPKTTPAAPKATPVDQGKASARAPRATVSAARDRRSNLPPPTATPTPLAPAADTGIASARGRATRPATTPRRRAVPAAPASISHVLLPAPATHPSHHTLEPTHDEVARRAYFIYLARVGSSGNPEQDWAAALSELRKERRLSLQEPQD